MINERLKNIRKYLGKSQEEMAILLTISLPAYRNYEQGSRDMKADTLQNLLKLDFDNDKLSGNWLLLGEGTMFIKKNNLKQTLIPDIAEKVGLLGKRLQRIQEVNQLTDTEISSITGMSDKRYRDIALGKDFPKLEELNKIKKHFNVDMDWLLYGDSEQKSPPIINNQSSRGSLPQLTPEQYAKLIKLLDQQ